MNTTRGIRTIWRLLLAPVAMLLSTTGAVRAANLDEGLLKSAPMILTYLKQEGYKNVGVLPFKVKKGEREASYLSAPLASNLPGRLENALIMSQGSNEGRAVGVIRDAAGTANQDKIGSYTRNPASFRAPFNAKYNLAWGNKKVKADAFVTGVVSNVGDRSETKITFQVITPKSRESGSLKPIDVSKPIVVKTDRSLLRDMGYTYALARSALQKGMTRARRDQQAVEQVAKQELGQKTTTQGQSGGVTPDNIAGMAFEIRYNGEKQTLRPLSQAAQGAKTPQYVVDPPAEGTTVKMVLTRLSEDGRTLGVVLKVNGKSTFQQQDEDSTTCRKWLYDADRKGKPDEFDGFYQDTTGRNLQRFRVPSAEEASRMASELGDRAGWIDIDVYASEEGGEKVDPKQPGGDEEEMKISSRGMARSKKGYSTLESLQNDLRKANHVKLKKSLVVPRGPGGLLLPENEPSEEVYIEQGALPKPVRLAGISIKYYDRGGDKAPAGE